MIVVKVGSKEIVVNNSLELIKDNLSSYKIVDGKRRPKIVYVKLTADETFYTTWLSAKIRKNSLDLFHLETPEEGKGFGRL